MAGEDSELERLRRIRERQLSDRDPGRKQQKLQQTITRKHRRSAQPFSMARMWAEVPKRWKGTLFGSIFGVVAVIVLPLVTDSKLATVIGLALLVFLALIGFLVGRARDTQDDVRDLLR